jgi:hypothetical protein
MTLTEARRPRYLQWLIILAIVSIFVVRSLLAVRGQPPRLDDVFTALTIAGALIAVLRGRRALRGTDLVIALALGALVGVTMLSATLFSPYPFFGIVRSRGGQAVVRGVTTAIAALGGLALMHLGGPVHLRVATCEWQAMGRSLGLGLAVGAPLAVLNVVALQVTEGRGLDWRSPLAATLDALQPAIVEEVVYRFALLGLLWWVLHAVGSRRPVLVASLLAMLIHSYSHLDDLLVQAPLAALGMGLALTLPWGLPLTLLAVRRDLESALGFHWVQDVARFVTGF